VACDAPGFLIGKQEVDGLSRETILPIKEHHHPMTPDKRKLGLSSYSYHLAGGIHPAHSAFGREGIAWVFERVRELKLDGIQLESWEVDEAVVKPLIEENGLYLEIAMALLERESLIDHLERAKRLGARVVRAFLSWDPLAWKRFDQDRPRLMALLEDAAQLAEQYRIPLAIENHSDYAAWQIAMLMGDLGSHLVGICFDSGNTPSSLEEPVQAARAAAPYVLQTHLRDCKLVHADYGLRYEGVALGEGDVDLAEVVRILQGESPAEAFSIESAVRSNPGWSIEENLRAEEEGVRRSVDYARTRLGL
jgi:sugar phosphate isomerase/epimerase